MEKKYALLSVFVHIRAFLQDQINVGGWKLLSISATCIQLFLFSVMPDYYFYDFFGWKTLTFCLDEVCGQADN